jgi:hypothetical protein
MLDKGVEKEMNYKKIGIIGVTMLVIVVAAFVFLQGSVSPPESLTNISPEKIIQTNGNITISASNNNYNVFDEFGLQRPIVNKKATPFKSYNSSKDLSEKIMKEAKLSDDSKFIIGTYDFGTSQILLIKRGDHVLEAFYDGKIVKTYLITPQLLGDKTLNEMPRKIVTPDGNNSDYTITTATRTQLYSLPLIYPDGDTVVASDIQPLAIDIIMRTRTDEYRNGQDVTIARLVSTGYFYVDIGSSITSITDSSSWWINPIFPGYSECFFTPQQTGVGTTSAQIYEHFKFGTLYLRYQMDIWVSMDAWGNGNDGGSTNQWSTINPDGCTN